MTAWPVVPLGDVATFVRGITFKPNDVVQEGTEGAVSCMRTKNVQRHLDLSDVWAIDRSHVKRQDQYLQYGDLLVSSANSWNLVGKCSWVPTLQSDSTFGGFVSALRPDHSKVNARYLYRFFSSARTQATLRSFSRQTTNISNLDLKRCATLSVPLPPLPEQHRIAAILDHADALRTKRREALAHLDELTQSIFIDMFGDELRGADSYEELRGKLEFLTSGSRGWAKYYAEQGDLFLRIQNVGNDELRLDDVAFVQPPGTAEAKRTRVEQGDVLLSITADLGRTAVVSEEASGGYINQHLAIIRTKAFAPRFLSRFLASPYGRGQVASKSRGGTKAGLNFEDIRSLKVACVSMEAQLLFDERVRLAERAIGKHREALVQLDSLFSSLQSRAFRGEL